MRLIVIPDPSLVVLIGAAGSGKSTFAARHFGAADVLSSDAYRALVAGDPADQSATRPAFRRLHADLGRRLRDKRLTVVDATNVTRHARRALLAHATRADIEAVAIVLDPPPDVVHAWNAGRAGRVVPAAAVDRHLVDLRRALEPGRLASEGFADVVVLAGVLEIDLVSVRRSPAR